MNIIVKDPIYKDPFEQADPRGNGSGKGDSNRTLADDAFRATLAAIQKRDKNGKPDYTGYSQIKPGVYRRKF